MKVVFKNPFVEDRDRDWLPMLNTICFSNSLFCSVYFVKAFVFSEVYNLIFSFLGLFFNGFIWVMSTKGLNVNE